MVTANNTINDLGFLDDITRTWLTVELAKDGPWQLKKTIKEQVNCFLNLYMCGDECSLDVRGFLCNHDPDEIWVNSIRTQVIPYLMARGVQ